MMPQEHPCPLGQVHRPDHDSDVHTEAGQPAAPQCPQTDATRPDQATIEAPPSTQPGLPFPTYDGRQPTAQEFFDAAVTRFRAQNYVQAKQDRGNAGQVPACLYRHRLESGVTNACLIGCGLPDNVLAAAETEVGGDMFDINAGLRHSISLRRLLGRVTEHLNALCHRSDLLTLQGIHDSAPANAGADHFEPRLQNWAETAGLIYTPPLIGGAA